MVVVQGAITARRSRGIAASRERTTTDRRPISGGSHHQSSPRSGRVLMWRRRPIGTTGDRPTRRVHRWGGRRMRCSRRRLRLHGSERGALQGRRRKGLRRCAAGSPSWPGTTGSRQRLCSLAIEPSHKCGIDMPERHVIDSIAPHPGRRSAAARAVRDRRGLCRSISRRRASSLVTMLFDFCRPSGNMREQKLRFSRVSNGEKEKSP